MQDATWDVLQWIHPLRHLHRSDHGLHPFWKGHLLLYDRPRHDGTLLLSSEGTIFAFRLPPSPFRCLVDSFVSFLPVNVDECT